MLQQIKEIQVDTEILQFTSVQSWSNFVPKQHNMGCVQSGVFASILIDFFLLKDKNKLSA